MVFEGIIRRLNKKRGSHIGCTISDKVRNMSDEEVDRLFYKAVKDAVSTDYSGDTYARLYSMGRHRFVIKFDGDPCYVVVEQLGPDDIIFEAEYEGKNFELFKRIALTGHLERKDYYQNQEDKKNLAKRKIKELRDKVK